MDRRTFGGFIEHLGRGISGGVFPEGSPLSDGRGVAVRERPVAAAGPRLASELPPTR